MIILLKIKLGSSVNVRLKMKRVMRILHLKKVIIRLNQKRKKLSIKV